MTKLLIVADDFTGSLDTGVHFAARGVSTRVFSESSCDVSSAVGNVQVIVVNSDSRHMSPRDAYDTVHRLATMAKEQGIPFLYKKTDSALRGNIGSELAAAMDAYGADRLVFVPAFPRMGRITRNGVQYIDGVPVAESVFGKDPFEPVCRSSVEEILRMTTDKTVRLHRVGEPAAEGEGVHLYDCEDDRDLERIASALEEKTLSVSAGCAAFASALAERLGLGAEPESGGELQIKGPLLVLCGSRNPVTLRQMETAEKAGFPHVRLTREQKTDWNAAKEENLRQAGEWIRLAEEKKLCIVDVNDPSPMELGRERVAAQLGLAGKALLDKGTRFTLLCTGGDTLLGVMRSAGVTEITPVGELFPGVVLTEMRYKGNTYSVISKSGGFGEPDLFCRMIGGARK